jgi:hypothetical protein
MCATLLRCACCAWLAITSPHKAVITKKDNTVASVWYAYPSTPLTYLLALRRRTFPWSGSRSWRRSSSRRRRWTRSGSCRSENCTYVANHGPRIRISKRNIVKNVESTAEIYKPVTSSICRSYDCAPLTNSRSVVCIREGNVP